MTKREGKKSRQRFPAEFKDEAVRLLETSGRPLEAGRVMEFDVPHHHHH